MAHNAVNENLNKGQKVAEKALWLESSIVVAKTVIGIASGSAVLISDAIHSGSDILSIFTSWLGLKISQKKPNKKFSYGFYKAESLGTLLISTIILLAAYNMFRKGISLFGSYSEIKVPIFALTISFLDAIILYFFGTYEIKVGKSTNTQSLIAMGKENRTHIFSSGIVFIGILASLYKYPNVEALFTLVISFLILKIGYESFRDSILTLMDISPSSEIHEKILDVLKNTPGIEEYSDLRLRESGATIFGEVKIWVRGSSNVKSANKISNILEEKVKESIPQVGIFNVKVAPFKTEYQHIAIPVENKEDLESKISQKAARAPFFIFVNLKNEQIIGHYFLGNPHKENEARAGLAVSKLISAQKVDALLVSEIGEISFYTLKENFIDIYKTDCDTAKKAIDLFVSESLSEVTIPTEK